MIFPMKKLHLVEMGQLTPLFQSDVKFEGKLFYNGT